MGTQPRIATNTIYHDAEHPSAIILPVLSDWKMIPNVAMRN